MDPRFTDQTHRDLKDTRVRAVRESLIQAGVPADKIKTGAFSDANLARDRRIEVLISTGS
jgi:outer membrane protein OmpA-like peptidoglycan-associated protein